MTYRPFVDARRHSAARDLAQRLAWLYGDAEARQEAPAQLADLEAWRRLGHPSGA